MESDEVQKLIARLTEDQAMELERIRLAMEINAEDTSGPDLDPKECRIRLEAKHGKIWNSYELARDFEVMRFAPPFVAVIRRADGQLGTVIFQHEPRFYWGFDGG